MTSVISTCQVGHCHVIYFMTSVTPSCAVGERLSAIMSFSMSTGSWCYIKPASDYQLLHMTKLANSPTTDAADDIVVSLSGSFQLDFVVHNDSDGFRCCCTRFKKLIGYDGSWQSERTHDVQLIVWAVLADRIGHRKPFAGFLPVASCHSQRRVNKWLAYLIHAFLSFLLHVSSIALVLNPLLIVSFDAKPVLHHSVMWAIIGLCWSMDRSDNGEHLVRFIDL